MKQTLLLPFILYFISILNCQSQNFTFTTVSDTACESYLFNGNLLDSTNTYVDTLNSQTGLDSVVTLNLTIYHNQDTALFESACGFFNFNGNIIDSTGLYADTIPTQNGCDSVITLDLTIQGPNGTILEDSACAFYIYNGDTLTQSGQYIDTLINQHGCDSVVAFVLTIFPAHDTTVFETGCNDFYYQGNHLTVGTDYIFLFQSENGCDSVVNLSLTLNNIDTSVTQQGDSLIAPGSASNYQWVVCNGQWTSVVGATNSTFAPQFNGVYAVIVSNPGCIDTSGCHPVTNVGIGDYELTSQLSFYPNPTNGQLNVKLGASQENINVSVLNATGQIVANHTFRQRDFISFELPTAKGLYAVFITVEDKAAAFRVLRE